MAVNGHPPHRPGACGATASPRFRSGEVAGLCLEDVNWEREIASQTARRTQEYPLVNEVGEAILRYLQRVRPRILPPLICPLFEYVMQIDIRKQRRYHRSLRRTLLRLRPFTAIRLSTFLVYLIEDRDLPTPERWRRGRVR
jgi:integrase